MVRGATLVLAIVLAATTAGAEGWESAITAEQMKGHVSAEDTVMVVRTGATDEETTAAATALIDAVKKAGAKVLDDSGLGDVSQLADSAIVPKAVAAGATAVATVRASAAGVPEISLYGKDGALRTKFTAMKAKGAAVAQAPPQPQPPPQPAAPPQPRHPTAAQKAQYQQQELGFGPYTVNTWQGPIPMYGPYQGRDHRALSMDEFFQLVGRQDLANEYQSRQSRRNTLVTGGGLVMLGSLVTAAILVSSAPQPADCDPFSADFNACENDVDHSRSVHYTSGLVVGVVGTLAGAGLAAAGYAVQPMPVSDAEAAALAKGYNDQLKRKLSGQRGTAPAPLQLSLRPELGPRGGGLTLGVKF